MSRHRHLLKRLSALPGSGTPRDYQELLGPTILVILEEAKDRAGVLVERQLAGSSYRPTPAELRKTWLEMKAEAQGARVEQIAEASQRCPYCEGVGQVRAYVHSRRKGVERVRAFSVACGCPKGQRLRDAQLHYGQRLSRGEFEVMAARQQAQSEWHDGVLAWHVDDCTTGARPEWARWAPALHPPENGGGLGASAWSGGGA